METLVLIVLAALFLLGVGPATRGTAAAFDALENPHRRETPEETRRNNADLVRLLVLVVAVFGLMFAIQLGG